MKLLTLDFETFYDQDYSLTKLTTEQYLRDKRFEIIGVSKKINNGPSIWFSGTHAEVKDFLCEDIVWDDTMVLSHHGQFDGGILNWHLGIDPKMYGCTMAMARPFYLKTVGVSLDAVSKVLGLGEKGHQVKTYKGKRRADFTPWELQDYGSYCVKDNDLCNAIFKKLVTRLTPLELKTIDTTIRMFVEPRFHLNKPLLEEHLAEIRAKKRELLEAIGGEDYRKILMSNEKLAELLRSEGVSPPVKLSKTAKDENGSPKLTFAFAKSDKAFKDLLEHPSPRVQAIVSARLGVKSTIDETRTENLIGIAERGLLPIYLNYCGAGTWRFSGGDGMNPQNFPKGGKIRSSIQAPAGYYVIVADLSQIEARITALIAGQSDVVEAFREGRDIYSEFASKVYGVVVTKADKERRFVGKTCILGLGFQMGPPRLRETLRIGMGGMSVVVTLEEAEHFVHVYRTENRHIRNLWYSTNDCIEHMAAGRSGYVIEKFGIYYEGSKIFLPNGQVLTYPGLRWDGDEQQFIYYNRKKPVKMYGGYTVENIVQSLARGVIVENMAVVGPRIGGIGLQVHDEIVGLVRKEDAPAAKAFIEKKLAIAPAYLPGLPVACECDFGPTYGDAK